MKYTVNPNDKGQVLYKEYTYPHHTRLYCTVSADNGQSRAKNAERIVQALNALYCWEELEEDEEGNP